MCNIFTANGAKNGFHSQAVQIFPTHQVFPEEAAGQKGAYYNSGGDQRAGRWGEEERVIQLVTSNPMGRRQIKPFCCTSEASFQPLGSCLLLFIWYTNSKHLMRVFFPFLNLSFCRYYLYLENPHSIPFVAIRGNLLSWPHPINGRQVFAQEMVSWSFAPSNPHFLHIFWEIDEILCR